MKLYGLSLPFLPLAAVSLLFAGGTEGRTEPTLCEPVWVWHLTSSCCWMACLELMQTCHVSPVRGEAVPAWQSTPFLLKQLIWKMH